MKINTLNTVETKSFSVNYEAVIDDLAKAFSEVIGLEYKDLILNRLKKINIINYFTNSQLKNFLENRGIELELNEHHRDEILKKYEKKFLNTLREQFPDIEIFSELSRFPISFSMFYNMFGEIVYKENILSELGFIKPQFGYWLLIGQEKIDYENNIIKTWDKFFSAVDLKKILEYSEEYFSQFHKDKENLLSDGNIKECIKQCECIDASLANDVLEGIGEDSILKCMHIHICSDSKEVLPIVLNPILYLCNSVILLSIIHEIAHAISVEKIGDSEKGIEIKAGMVKYLVNNNDWETPNNYNYLNEAITQYIANEVTRKLLETNFISKFFNFEIPLQEADLYSSYSGCLLFGKDFIEKNRRILFAAYIENKHYKELLDTMDLDKIEALFCESYSNYSIEELEQIKSKNK